MGMNNASYASGEEMVAQNNLHQGSEKTERRAIKQRLLWLPLHVYDFTHLEDRQEHTDYHSPDYNTEKYDQQWLDQRSKTR
jgi:hypothetical protein